MTDIPDEFETPEQEKLQTVHIPVGTLTKSGTYRIKPAVEFTDKMGAQWAILFLSEDQSQCFMLYMGLGARRVLPSQNGEWVSLATFEERFGVPISIEETPAPSPAETVRQRSGCVLQAIAILLTTAAIVTGIVVKSSQEGVQKELRKPGLIKKDTERQK